MLPVSRVTWHPPDISPPDLARSIGEHFGLTPALASLAIALPDHPTCAALAAALRKSEHTIRTQVRQLCDRLGVESHISARVHIVAQAWRHTLVAHATRHPAARSH
jgi:hypothetical protein